MELVRRERTSPGHQRFAEAVAAELAAAAEVLRQRPVVRQDVERALATVRSELGALEVLAENMRRAGGRG